MSLVHNCEQARKQHDAEALCHTFHVHHRCGCRHSLQHWLVATHNAQAGVCTCCARHSDGSEVLARSVRHTLQQPSCRLACDLQAATGANRSHVAAAKLPARTAPTLTCCCIIANSRARNAALCHYCAWGLRASWRPSPSRTETHQPRARTTRPHKVRKHASKRIGQLVGLKAPQAT